MEHLIRKLRSQNWPFNDGLAPGQIRIFEKRLYCTLPADVRLLYQDHDGVEEHSNHRLFHLMPHESAIEFNGMKEQNSIAFCGEDIFDVAGEDPARVFWTDFNANYAGVFVTGPDAGKVFVFDHDEPRLAVRYRTVRSFVERLASAAGTDLLWQELRSDFED